MAETTKTTKAEVKVEPLDPMKDMVDIRLMKDSDKYRDDVFVGINGKTWQIQRGVTVSVPRPVAEVIENAERQRGAAEEYIESIRKR